MASKLLKSQTRYITSCIEGNLGPHQLRWDLKDPGNLECTVWPGEQRGNFNYGLEVYVSDPWDFSEERWIVKVWEQPRGSVFDAVIIPDVFKAGMTIGECYNHVDNVTKDMHAGIPLRQEELNELNEHWESGYDCEQYLDMEPGESRCDVGLVDGDINRLVRFIEEYEYLDDCEPGYELELHYEEHECHGETSGTYDITVERIS